MPWAKLAFSLCSSLHMWFYWFQHQLKLYRCSKLLFHQRTDELAVNKRQSTSSSVVYCQWHLSSLVLAIKVVDCCFLIIRLAQFILVSSPSRLSCSYAEELANGSWIHQVDIQVHISVIMHTFCQLLLAYWVQHNNVNKFDIVGQQCDSDSWASCTLCLGHFSCQRLFILVISALFVVI